jgi:2-methylcitrate dehydratase PrpD
VSSVAENLAELVLKPRFKDLTEEVVHQTKRVLIDSLACLLGGYPSEAAKAIIDMVRTQSKVPESTIIGEGLKTLVPHAILANGVMLRFLDYMDTYVIPLKAGKEPLQGCHPCEDYTIDTGHRRKRTSPWKGDNYSYSPWI